MREMVLEAGAVSAVSEPVTSATVGTVAARAVRLAVLVSALGYFVDMFDMVLFNIYRTSSLTDLGISSAQHMNLGVTLINLQMGGMLLGGVVWGVLGDKLGRTAVLMGSILLYSAANIANGFVHTVEQYEVLRFLAGLGLAGELGAAIALVSEMSAKHGRGLRVSTLMSIGLGGAIAAALMGGFVSWRVGYVVGGCMGLCLLALRTTLTESNAYVEMKKTECRRGSVRMFLQYDRFKRLVCCALIAIPIWIGGVMVLFAPEFNQALDTVGRVTSGDATLFGYLGVAIGTYLAGLVTQRLQSRKKAIYLFLTAYVVLNLCFLTMHGLSAPTIKAFYIAKGMCNGGGCLIYMMAAEIFGTNLRATVATAIPNVARASMIPMTLALQWLTPRFGILSGAGIITAAVAGLALCCLSFMPETFTTELNYIEK